MVKYKQDLQQIDLFCIQGKQYFIKRAYIIASIIFLLTIPLNFIYLYDSKIFTVKKMAIYTSIYFFICVAYVMFSYLKANKIFKQYKENYSYETEKEILVNEKGIFIKDYEKETNIQIFKDDVEKIKTYKDIMIISLNKRGYFILPNNKEMLQEFRNYFKIK